MEAKDAHTGTNLGALQRMVNDADKWQFVRRSLSNFVRAMHEREKEFQRLKTAVLVITVAVYCKWGKHRSVALGELLKGAFNHMGCKATIEHLSKPTCLIKYISHIVC